MQERERVSRREPTQARGGERERERECTHASRLEEDGEVRGPEFEREKHRRKEAAS